MNKINKRGISEVITVILIIIGVIILILILWSLISDFVIQETEISEAKLKLTTEKMGIEKVKENSDNPNILLLTLKKGAGKINIVNSEEFTDISIDIALVTDRSGSMRQSGWTSSISYTLLPSFEFNNVNVPRNSYSSSFSFNVPAGTERLIVSLTWGMIPGLSGSEGSEFALNLRRPSGTWIFGNAQPNLGNRVDPPDSAGASNEFFSGISTKPQQVYIENPQAGNWNVRVYGWNLRPSTSPPNSQNADIKIYMGSSDEIIRNPTIISIEAAKDSLNDFVDNMEDTERAAYIVFGSSGNAPLLQGLTEDKSLLHTAIDNTGLQGGTAIQGGINTARTEFSNNARADAEKVMIILTDGQNDAGPDSAIQAAESAKSEDITIFTIGLTGFVNEPMLKTIASLPEYYYYTETSGLIDTYRSISQNIQEISNSVQAFSHLKVIFHTNSGTYQKQIEFSNLPTPLESKIYEIDLTDLGITSLNDITKIEIYPVALTKSGKEIIGPKLDSWSKGSFYNFKQKILNFFKK